MQEFIYKMAERKNMIKQFDKAVKKYEKCNEFERKQSVTDQKNNMAKTGKEIG